MYYLMDSPVKKNSINNLENRKEGKLLQGYGGLKPVERCRDRCFRADG
jgi:hypothetical protein